MIELIFVIVMMSAPMLNALQQEVINPASAEIRLLQMHH